MLIAQSRPKPLSNQRSRQPFLESCPKHGQHIAWISQDCTGRGITRTPHECVEAGAGDEGSTPTHPLSPALTKALTNDQH